eukprot:485999_1
MSIDTLNDQQKFKLFVPYPKGLELLIPDNPEAQFFCGVLSAKLAIIKYNKSQFAKTKKNAKKHKMNEKTNATDEETNGIQSTQKRKRNAKNNKKKKRNQKRSRLSLDDLNKRIAQNTHGEPKKKKRKLNKKAPKSNPNEMNLNDAHELIDGVVDKLENEIKQKRQKEMNKDEDIKQYLAQRAQKRKNKELRKKELREEFQQRRNAKKKSWKMQRKSVTQTSAKKVRFNL